MSEREREREREQTKYKRSGKIYIERKRQVKNYNSK